MRIHMILMRSMCSGVFPKHDLQKEKRKPEFQEITSHSREKMTQMISCRKTAQMIKYQVRGNARNKEPEGLCCGCFFVFIDGRGVRHEKIIGKEKL